MTKIKPKRVSEKPPNQNGFQVFEDRLWPRNEMKKYLPYNNNREKEIKIINMEPHD